LLVASSWCQALAATLKTSVTKDGRVVVSISGEIVEGDTESFKAAIKAANDSGKLVSSIRLNSPGGNLIEGAELANAVRFAKMATNVGQGATCASACFLVFAAGETKFANYTAQIGVHGASDQSGQETVQSGAATVSMARIAKDLGVPAAIIGRMVVTPPSEMVWLSPGDLQSMGTSMVGKPVQVSSSESQIPSQQPGPGEPVQIAPQTKASREVPTWSDILQKAIRRSAEQNGGKPQFSRFCQPEQKVCITGLSFTQNDGKDGFLKTVENMDGKIVVREVCSFNDFKDVRYCLNWDTGAAHRDMKNERGDWVEISGQ
jgi:hypothetical protein